MDFPPVTANHTRQNSKDFHFLFLFNFEHVQGCVGPHFSVYNIPVPNNPCRKRTVLPSLLRSSAVSLLPGGGGGSETGGEAIEMRAMNLVCLPLCLVWFCMGFFINWAAPFSTNLCDCRTIVEKKKSSFLYIKRNYPTQ